MLLIETASAAGCICNEHVQCSSVRARVDERNAEHTGTLGYCVTLPSTRYCYIMYASILLTRSNRDTPTGCMHCPDVWVSVAFVYTFSPPSLQLTSCLVSPCMYGISYSIVPYIQTAVVHKDTNIFVYTPEYLFMWNIHTMDQCGAVHYAHNRKPCRSRSWAI